LTLYETGDTDFKGHWVSMVCDVDKIFRGAGIDIPIVGFQTQPIKALSSSSMEFPQHELVIPTRFNEFRPNPRNADGVGTGSEPVEILQLRAKRNSKSDFSSDLDAKNQRSRAGTLSDFGNLDAASIDDDAALFSVPAVAPPGPGGMLEATDPAEDVSMYSTDIVPEDLSGIAFPRIQNMNNRIPDDSVSALKSSFYEAPVQSRFGATSAAKTKKKGKMNSTR
jgi:hypothetical protein